MTGDKEHEKGEHLSRKNSGHEDLRQPLPDGSRLKDQRKVAKRVGNLLNKLTCRVRKKLGTTKKCTKRRGQTVPRGRGRDAAKRGRGLEGFFAIRRRNYEESR